MPDCILTPPTDESVITYTQLSGVHGVDTQSHVLPTIQSQFSDINLSFVSQQATASQVIDDVMRQLSFDETELDGEAGFADVAGSGVDSSGLSHDESFGVDDLDLNLNEPVNLNVSQVETQSELPVSEEPDVGPAQEPILAEVSTQEPIVAEVSTQEPIVAEVGTQEFSVEDVVIEDYVSSGEDGEDAEQGNGQEDESARTDGEFFHDDEGIDTAYETEYDVQSSEDAGTDDDDDVDEDFLVDEENEIVKDDVDVHFDPSNDEERNYRKRRLAELRAEMEGVINASGQWKIRARCEGKVPVFTMSQGTGPTGPNRGMEAGPSGSSGPTTRSKKKKNTCTNDHIQASPSFLDAHDKGDLCPWVLYVGKGKFIQNWVVKSHKDTHTCLQSREIKHCTYKFLSKKIFKQVRANPDIPVKVVQDQLQRELEVQISMSKSFRAKAKAEREIRGDHVLQYSMLRDYVVELQSINPNTTIKIAVKRNTDPSLPTRVFQRIYVCQVLVAVGLDSNNGIYPLAYALVEAESKSSWCWFLQCLGDDIDLHPNSNITFISDRQKGIILAIKTVYPIASATNVKDFQKCILELKTMNPKAHEWLNKIPAKHWARSHFSGRAKSDLLLNNICEVFNGKIVGGRDKLVITLLEYIREYCIKRIVNVQGVIDKCTGPLTPTATRIMEFIKKEAHLMKVQWNGENKYQVSGSLACWNMALNDRAAPPPETWDQLLGEIYMSNNTFATQASCPETLDTIRQHVKDNVKRQQQVATMQKAVVVGVVIGLSAAAGEGGAGDPGGAGVASQGSSHTRWTRRRVQTERISPQKRTPTQPANQPSTSSQVPVSQTRNADGREMGDGVPTQSSAAGGASEWSFL
ncbi:heat stress transcription factor B-4-like protein [Tanacetum coccineum]